MSRAQSSERAGTRPSVKTQSPTSPEPRQDDFWAKQSWKCI